MKNKKKLKFKIGEVVVYPKHGVGEITKIENMEIANIKTQFYVVKMEQSKLIIRVPLEKSVTHLQHFPLLDWLYCFYVYLYVLFQRLIQYNHNKRRTQH